MDELHDVAAQTPSNNDGLFYNSTNLLWENKSIATALGYTPANAATTLTINGVTYDLSANRTWTVAAGISGSGASGQVAYWTGTSAQSGSNNLFWDNANGRLGIGTNAPSTALHLVRNDNNFNQQLIIDNPNSGANAISYFTMRLNSVSGGGVAYYGANYNNVSQRNSLIFYSNDGVKLGFISNAVGTGTNQDIYFATKLNNTNLTLFSTGNLLVQNGSTHTDSGQRLQVQGTTLLNGNVTFSSSTGMFWDAANTRLGIGTNAPTSAISILKPTGQQATMTFRTLDNTQTNGYSGFNCFDESNNLAFSFAYGNSGSVFSNTAIIGARTATGKTQFVYGASATVAATLFSNGNFGFGSTNDSGERLQVTGNVLINGASGNVFFVKSSGGSNLFYIQNAGTIGFTAYTWTPESTSGTVTLTASASRSWNVTGDKTNTSGVGSAFFVTSGFAPTSGTGQYNAQTINPTINQTGGANGITRGLYVNPTLTAAADFRAIETTNGKVIFGNLPTSSAGLPTGAIWNDAGTIKIV
jgi:hypothetical protein